MILQVPTLNDLLTVERLRLVPRGGVDGGHRPVRWVYVTELADPSAYLRGGELVLTNGLWRRRRVDSQRFVASLVQKRVSGLGYGLEEVTATVPKDLIEACERHALPLLEVRQPVSFSAISETIAGFYFEEREAELLKALNRGEALVNALARGSGISGILRVLERDRGIPTTLLAGGARVYSAGPPLVSPSEARRVWNAAVRARTLPTALATGDGAATVAVFGVRGCDEGAYLLCRRELDQLREEERGAIQQTISFLSVELARTEAVRRVEFRFAGELLAMLGAGEGHRAEIDARLRSFGLQPSVPLGAIAASPDGGDKAGLGEAVQGFLSRNGVASVTAYEGEHAVALVAWPGPDSALRALAEELLRTLEPAHAAAAVGIGSLARGIDHLHRSVTEARQACHFAILHRRGPRVVWHLDVGSHMLLLELQEAETRTAFGAKVLGPVTEYDRHRRTELIKTLEVFLATCGQWKVSAERLHVHVNTLRHRLSRIEELTGRDLSSMSDRVDLFIALEAREPAELQASVRQQLDRQSGRPLVVDREDVLGAG